MIRSRTFAACMATVVGVSAVVAVGADAPTRIPTVTRLVKLFMERETQLGDAVRAGDAAGVERNLAEDFELRVGARPGRPVPRADFVQAIVQGRDAGGEITAMAANDVGGAVVVSYTQASRSGPLFVVDVWRMKDDDWKLAIRYASPAGSARTVIPGAGAEEAVIPKKY